MKKIILIYTILIGAFLVYFTNYLSHNSSSDSWGNEGLRGEIDEKYVDVCRRRYARTIGREEEWEALTPVIPAT